MLLFLDLAYDEAKAKGRLRSMADLHEAIIHGAVKRLRPKMMTVTAAMIGLMPIMWSIGTGSDVMKRVAAPMVGGLATSFLLELLVYPAIYLLWRWHTEVRQAAAAARSRKKVRPALTEAQGAFLYHLPFPGAEPLSVAAIMKKAAVDESRTPEILDIIGRLEDLGVVETRPGARGAE
jgi:hypothetical protein